MQPIGLHRSACYRCVTKKGVGEIMIAQNVSRVLLAGLLAAVTGLSFTEAEAKKFTPGKRVPAMIAAKYPMPVFFALPDSARADLPEDIDTTDILVDYRHPDSEKVGLRVVLSRRSGWADRLARSGLVQSGDLLLSFRPEWGGAGAYPNVQMGISHTGLAYVKNGRLYNIENPMNSEYLGFNSEHYRTLDMIHIIRPRNLTDEQRNNIAEWAGKLRGKSGSIYPGQIKFNDDYNDPKYRPGKSPVFVKELGQTALGQSIPSAPLGMYCSEFAWSVLSLRNCDPDKTSSQFSGSRVPSCVSEPMKPMEATGKYIFKQNRYANAGLADGPLLVIDSLDLPQTQRADLLKSVFVQNSQNMGKLSSGHRAVAEQFQSDFEKLEKYYLGTGKGVIRSLRARFISFAFRRAVPDNYSPTSYLINTLLPKNNVNRTMDYVATVVFQ